MKKTKADLEKEIRSLRSKVASITRYKYRAEHEGEKACRQRDKYWQELRQLKTGRMPYCGKTCGTCCFSFSLDKDEDKDRVRCMKHTNLKSVVLWIKGPACADYMPHGC